ncbi:hypothetical protein GCM10011391_20500 [Pullulanibacillus camelliae]|uniref:Gfo/Idh/MocA-like oxidoreductase N-terminal domain-containing protein n=1 Tax=Pullulanibacillus camelliae TaxID=1707096 RepID=A0A8J2VW69_9BACL|nr:Gfo/Idh/MocA family oxidoreductase [Pullulanibacillus camelliae]GGE41637.1 hypothetical protein GCM10011391_20500 [Pullulanibacillus camelliae]
MADTHVFVEKPFTHSLEEALEIEALVKQHPVQVQIGHVERFNPVYQALIQQVQWEDIVSIAFKRHIPLRKKVDVDIILAVMVHDLDLLLHISQQLSTSIKTLTANAVTDRHLLIPPLLDNVCVMSTLSNGILAQLSSNRSGAHHERRIQIIEKERTLNADLLNNEIEILSRQNKNTYAVDRQIIKIDQNNALREEMQGFIKAIQSGERPEINEKDGREVMALIDTIMKAIRTQRF